MPYMLRRFFVSALLSSPFASGLPQAAWAEAAFQPTVQDRADIARIETYLNGLSALRAQFLQVAPDGAITQGSAWLARPGRMRFQYDPPAPFLLVAAHGELVFQDSSIKQTSRIPLNRTPLGMLLAPKVTLSGDVTVVGMKRLPGEIDVSIVRTDSPGEGILTLVFAHPPLTLRQWTVLDAQRKETRVTLFNAQLGGTFDPKLFETVEMPTAGTGGGG